MVKALFATAAFLLSLSNIASAMQMAEVTEFKVIKLDGMQMEVTYETGGGCGVHSPYFAVELQKDKNNKGYVAFVSVYDTTEEADNCDALIVVEGQSDLSALIRQEMEKKSIDPSQVPMLRLQLPQSQVRL